MACTQLVACHAWLPGWCTLHTSCCCLQLWDTRKLKASLHTFSDLPTNHSETNCCFSPDQRLVLTGTSALKDGSGSALHFFDVQK